MKVRTRGFDSGSRSRRMAFEPLEQRAMLAGNVNVFVSGGSLIVRGDNAANGVFISQLDDDSYAVTGFALGVNGNGSTRINGQADASLVFNGVSGDINVDLRGGNDVLGIGNSPEELIALAEECGFTIDIGIGEVPGDGEMIAQQQVDGRFFVPRNLIVNTGSGHDAMAITADVEFSAIINTGSGDDVVAFGNLAELESDLNLGGNLIITTGSGIDDVCAQFVTVNGVVNVQTGDSADSVRAHDFDAGTVVVGTGNGNDLVGLSSFETDGGVVVTTAGGNDTVLLGDFSAGQGLGPNEHEGAGHVTVVTGAGHDNVALTFFEADSVVIDTGAGNDGTLESPVEVQGALVDSLTIVTGAGNDVLLVHTGEAIEASTVTGNVVVNTGAGHDSVALADLDIRNHLFAFLGAGNDDLFLLGVDVGGIALLDAGAGNDEVALGDSFVEGDTTILMGSGNDSLTIVGSGGDGRLVARGGSGTDTFTSDLGITGNVRNGDVDVQEFEIFLLDGDEEEEELLA